jgi:cupin fold WbuC family metalloprotein
MYQRILWKGVLMSLSTTFFADQDIVEIDLDRIKMLKEAAENDPLKRARLCLHKSHNDRVQEMVIALCGSSYVRPHRHTDKSEAFHIIEGELAVILFDNAGSITQIIRMGQAHGHYTFMYRLNDNIWHTVVPLSETVVFHESASGPFVEGEGEFAEWSPDYQDTKGIDEYMERLKEETAAT